MLKTYKICENKVITCDKEEGQIFIYILPNDNEKAKLVSEYNIDEHTLTSSLDQDEPARLEFEPEHMAVIFKRPKNYSAQDKLLFKISSMGFFLFKDCLIITLSEDVSLFEGKIFNKTDSVQKLFLNLMYRNIFHFMEHLKSINMIVNEVEEKINTSTKNLYIIELFVVQKSLVYYLDAISSNSMIIEKIKNYGLKIGFSSEYMEFIDDISIDNNQCYKQAEIYSSILSGLMDARTSIIGNNLNLLMKTLNVITVIIMIPSMVTSLFSMNVDVPLHNNPYAFWIILGFSLLSLIGFSYFWKKQEW